MYFINKAPVIFYGTFIIGVLDDSTEISSVNRSCFIITFCYFYSHRNCSCHQQVFCLRKDFPVYKKRWSFYMILFVQCIEEHGHGFCGSRAFIQQRGIGNRQSSQVADHGLKIQQAFQTAL